MNFFKLIISVILLLFQGRNFFTENVFNLNVCSLLPYQMSKLKRKPLSNHFGEIEYKGFFCEPLSLFFLHLRIRKMSNLSIVYSI